VTKTIDYRTRCIAPFDGQTIVQIRRHELMKNNYECRNDVNDNCYILTDPTRFRLNPKRRENTILRFTRVFRLTAA